MKEVVMIDAARTPIGKYRGSLSPFTAVELGTLVTKGLLDKTKLKKDKIDQVIFGNVLQAGNGQNVARQIALNSGLPVDVPAMTINEVCGSGMKAVILARQLIQLGEAELVIAGGTESMSQAPMLKQYQSETNEYGEPISSMVNDGLTDAFSNAHMGLTAEKVATQFSVSREEQDRYALSSQLKAAHAVEAGVFSEEIIPVKISDEDVLSEDEAVRGNSTLEKLGTLRTVFSEEGTVTAGNASPINDGSCVLLMMSAEKAKALGYKPIAKYVAATSTALSPSIMGYAPVSAIEKLEKKTGISRYDVGLYELNEAFAAQAAACVQDLKLDPEIVNVNGGAVALGHAVGCTGARISLTLMREMQRRKVQYGVASLCIGGGQAMAMMFELCE